MVGGITLSSAWLGTVVFLSLRLAAVFLLTPLLAAASVPVTVRVLLILGLSSALALGLPSGLVGGAVPAQVLSSPGAMIEAGFSELGLGATLALGILVAFAAFSVAGEVLGVQMSFGMGQVLDPATNRSQSVVTTAFNQIAVLVFFLVNGHHALLRGIAYSLERFPLARPWPVEPALAPMLHQVLGLFTLAFALSVPVVFCLLMVEMALGVVARNMPQMNMISMGIPVKIIVGLVALSLWMGGMGDAMGRVYASIYRCWDEIFAVSLAAPPALDRAHAALGPSVGRQEVS